MHLVTGYENRKARIEIVPLVDVIFLLLVFFIYAILSMTYYRGLRMDLPSGSGVVEKDIDVLISIDADNCIWMNGRVISLNDAVEAASSQVAGSDRPVIISGDSASDLGVAIELLSGLRGANVAKVSFRVSGEEE